MRDAKLTEYSSLLKNISNQFRIYSDFVHRRFFFSENKKPDDRSLEREGGDWCGDVEKIKPYPFSQHDYQSNNPPMKKYLDWKKSVALPEKERCSFIDTYWYIYIIQKNIDNILLIKLFEISLLITLNCLNLKNSDIFILSILIKYYNFLAIPIKLNILSNKKT